MSEQKSDDAATGAWVLTVGAAILWLGQDHLGFLAFAEDRELLTLTELSGGRGLLYYILGGLMIGCAFGYSKREDRDSRGARWLYRGAVWIGVLQVATAAINLGMWWFWPERMIVGYLATQPEFGLGDLDVRVLREADLSSWVKDIAYSWWGSAVMLLGWVLLVLGVLGIYRPKE